MCVLSPIDIEPVTGCVVVGHRKKIQLGGFCRGDEVAHEHRPLMPEIVGEVPVAVSRVHVQIAGKPARLAYLRYFA